MLNITQHTTVEVFERTEHVILSITLVTMGATAVMDPKEARDLAKLLVEAAERIEHGSTTDNDSVS